MKTFSDSIGNFNEVIFENRNKNYGAYAIRKSERETITKALSITILAMLSITIFSIWLTPNVPPKVTDLGNIAPIIEPLFGKEIILIQKEKKTIVENKDVEKTKPITDNLNVVATDKKTNDVLKTNTDVTIIKDGDVKGKDSVADNSTTTIDTKNIGDDTKIFGIPSEMPEFQGDLFKYLSNNLSYPQIAVEASTSGIVYLGFVVEKDGSIDEIKVLKSVTNGCTEEAIRVLKSMPKWKPGKNNGKPVRVQYTLPIKFTIRN